MATNLKLRRDVPEPDDSGTLKFPAHAVAPSRRPQPVQRPRLTRDDDAPGGDGDRDTVISSDELVRQIESTLDRMQNRLTKFKRQLNNDMMKFPVQSEDGPPPRTAA